MIHRLPLRCLVLQVFALVVVFQAVLWSSSIAIAAGQPAGDESAEPKANEPAPAISDDGEIRNWMQSLSKQLQAQQRMYEVQRNEYQAALAELDNKLKAVASESRQLKQQQAITAGQRAQYEKQLAMAREEQAKKSPVPDDAVPRAFALNRIKANDVAQILSRMYGDAAMRIAVDEPRNLLLVLSDDKTAQTIAELLQSLDQPAATSDKSPTTAQTLQLRIMWIADAPENADKQPASRPISPEVGDALEELGIGKPRIVSQQVTSLVVSGERSDPVHFEVPVLLDGSVVRFRGDGSVEPMDDDRYAVRLRLSVVRPIAHGSKDYIEDDIEGSIYAPLGHYTVLGTTTFISTPPAAVNPAMMRGEMGMEGGFRGGYGEMGRGGYGGEVGGEGMAVEEGATGPQLQQQPQQHLSAFVVYLDRAREFPAANTFKRQSEGKDTQDPFGQAK